MSRNLPLFEDVLSVEEHDRKEKGSEIGDMLRRIVSQIFFISSHFISSQINTRIQSGLKQDEKKRNAKASLDGDSDPETEPASS
ncbi:hypothetical protein IEQ34_023266 [Dendrobium chrysotoxum]|uniref:Uncharacterized protein n=1 Tax=Dendrobium chrysotoxum TaxID=161865 RepID=A0AAV7FP42_DENCH|nr:hypothetical protein IEQ34_026133 [Dendrobium chrysotoxum]KAH0438984.1 hypothetical protein IEQ34_025986 [Dendrobium chrysotoxum]KAH0439319.1 hypothetical protein IEQ34_025930 [Dendrobium chrysotoxum]KAH0440530.1 hypothetical protein IEQ34_025553 [Dendrobium chrysotoxum]KAH0445452.1 hypothetical protein IEQ34_025459 [Dendrobium chrysotoxum]